jgi:hypothetical protein
MVTANGVTDSETLTDTSGVESALGRVPSVSETLESIVMMPANRGRELRQMALKLKDMANDLAIHDDRWLRNRRVFLEQLNAIRDKAEDVYRAVMTATWKDL